MPPSFSWPRASKAGLGGGLMMEQTIRDNPRCTTCRERGAQNFAAELISHRLNLSVFSRR